MDLVVDFTKDNLITPEGCIGIGEGIKELINLISLKVEIGYPNKIKGDGVEGIGNGLKTLK